MIDSANSVSVLHGNAPTPTFGSGSFSRPVMKLVLDSRGLADALSLPLNTVRQYASKFPEKLPPRLNHPGRKLMWSVEDVEAWVRSHRAISTPTQPGSGCNTPSGT